jgi:hypothetical protein
MQNRLRLDNNIKNEIKNLKDSESLFYEKSSILYGIWKDKKIVNTIVVLRKKIALLICTIKIFIYLTNTKISSLSLQFFISFRKIELFKL